MQVSARDLVAVVRGDKPLLEANEPLVDEAQSLESMYQCALAKSQGLRRLSGYRDALETEQTVGNAVAMPLHMLLKRLHLKTVEASIHAWLFGDERPEAWQAQSASQNLPAVTARRGRTTMKDAQSKRQDLRKMLNSGRLSVAPGAHNALTAKMIVQAGFPAVYMTGSGVANTLLGQADVGLLTLGEMTTMAHYLAEAVDVPVVSDADTGYGNAINVIRTVREFESAGVAGIHIEDKVTPKRCGHIVGKELISVEEMAGKLAAAVDARRDPDFVITARTDARGPLGLEETIERANRYAEAGADAIFPDALLSEDEFRTFAREVRCPKMMNMGGYATTRTTPKLALDVVEEIGFNLVIFPLALVRAGARAIQDFLTGLAERGTAFEEDYIETLVGHPMENWYEFSGIGDVRRLEEKYLSADALKRKYEGGKGYLPTAHDNR